jgi:hypothetical protein
MMMNKWSVEDWENYAKNRGPLLLEGYGLRMKDGQFFLCTHVDPPGLGWTGDYDVNHSDQWRYQLFDDGTLTWVYADTLCEYLVDGANIVVVS